MSADALDIGVLLTVGISELRKSPFVSIRDLTEAYNRHCSAGCEVKCLSRFGLELVCECVPNCKVCYADDKRKVGLSGLCVSKGAKKTYPLSI
jgi:hypothetical protein